MFLVAWRDWLTSQEAHGVATFEVVAKPPGSNTYAVVNPRVSFEAAYRWASSSEKYNMGKTDTLKVARIFADPPLQVTEKQGLRSTETGVLNTQVFNVTQAVEERDAGIVLIIAERTS